MNGDDSGDENSLKGFYAYKNTFDDDTIWMNIPKNGMTMCEVAQCILLNRLSDFHKYNKSLSGSLYTRV